MTTKLGEIDLNIQESSDRVSSAARSQQGFVPGVRAAGGRGGAAAGGAAAAGGLASVAKAAGVVAGAFAAVAVAGAIIKRTITTLNQNLRETANRLAEIDPRVAMARAEEDIAQVMRDLRRANLIGGMVSNLERDTTRLRDRMSSFGDVIMGIWTTVRIGLIPIMEFAITTAKRVVVAILEGVAMVIRGLVAFDRFLRSINPFAGDEGEGNLNNTLLGIASLLKIASQKIDNIDQNVDEISQGQRSRDVSQMFLRDLEALAGQNIRIQSE